MGPEPTCCRRNLLGPYDRLGFEAQASFPHTGAGDMNGARWWDFLRTRERRFQGVKLLAAVMLATVCLGVPVATARSTVVCSSPGDWPHTRDAAWLARALTRAGLGSFGCTGSAFVVDLGADPSASPSAGQIYVWTTRGRLLVQPTAHTRIAGVVVRYDRVRGVWNAKGRNVWVQTASSERLLPVHRWGRIVRATLATRG
jgi:hypothetical protein